MDRLLEAEREAALCAADEHIRACAEQLRLDKWKLQWHGFGVQTNSVDCGVYCMAFIELVAAGTLLEHMKVRLQERHIPVLRRYYGAVLSDHLELLCSNHICASWNVLPTCRKDPQFRLLPAPSPEHPEGVMKSGGTNARPGEIDLTSPEDTSSVTEAGFVAAEKKRASTSLSSGDDDAPAVSASYDLRHVKPRARFEFKP